MCKGSKRFSSLALLALLAWGTACDFHDGRFSGEFNAGGADPYSFPPPYRGAGARREVPASGVFTEVGAFARGRKVGYYLFPFSPAQIDTTGYAPPSPIAWPGNVVDPLRVAGPGTETAKSGGNPVPVPLVYNFDPPGGSEPFAASARCKAPSNYRYDRYAEAFPRTEQWDIFTTLPDRFASFPMGGLPSWTYRPVVAEVTVRTADLDCQSVKSERTLLASADQKKVEIDRAEPLPDGTRRGQPDGRYLAWALIDPGAAVVRVGEEVDIFSGGKVSGTSVQKYGWFNQFIVAYIDGGYIPVEDGPEVAGVKTQRMRPQRLYYPRTNVISGGTTKPGALGQGYDVVQADRFNDGDAYSPVCEVWTYALPAATAVEDLPRDEASVVALAGSTLEPARTVQSPAVFMPSTAIVPRYVFCLQAAPLP